MKIIPIYLFLLGWTSAFALYPWVPMPMFISVLIFVMGFFIILRSKKVNGLDSRILFLFYSFILTLFVSFTFQTFTIGFKLTGFTHTLSYLGVIFAYLLGVTVFISSKEYPMEKIYKYLSWGVVTVSIITIFEFVGRNFFNISFDFLRIPVENNSTYGFGGERFIRARGTTVESGHLAMYLLMFSPFVYHYQVHINKSKAKALFSLSVVLFSLLFTFSAAGFAELLIGLSLLVVIGIKKAVKNGFKFSQILLIYPIFCGLAIYAVYYFFIKKGSLTFLSGIFGKLTLTNYSIDDGGSRLARWHRAWELFKESPIIGHGPGISAINHGTGSTSMYLELLIEAGLVGLGIFIVIMILHLIKLSKLKGNIKYVYLISFVVMSIHLAIISEYWYPWMWTLFLLINVQYYRQKKESRVQQSKVVSQ